MRKTMYVLAIIGGLLAALGGLLAGLVFVLVAVSGSRVGEAALQVTTFAIAIPLIGLCAGGTLVWLGARALGDAPDRPLRLLPWWLWFLATILVLGIGRVAFSGSSGPEWLLPILHVTAGALAALLFLALAVGAARARGAFVPARPMLASFAWGALGASAIAMLVEVMLLLIAALALAAWLAATQPGLLQELQDWAMTQSLTPGRPPDLGGLTRLTTSPVVVAAVLAGLGIVVPIIEELTKSLAVPLVALTGRRLTRLDGFLLGVAAGAGFTLLEGILNGSLALANPRTWASAMLVRGATAALHCLATGLGGLAWQSALVERRGLRAAGLALAAVAVHGMWNTGASLGLVLDLVGGLGRVPQATLIAQAAATGCMGLLWVGVVTALPLVASQLARQAPATIADPAGETPLPPVD